MALFTSFTVVCCSNTVMTCVIGLVGEKLQYLLEHSRVLEPFYPSVLMILMTLLCASQYGLVPFRMMAPSTYTQQERIDTGECECKASLRDSKRRERTCAHKREGGRERESVSVSPVTSSASCLPSHRLALTST